MRWKSSKAFQARSASSRCGYRRRTVIITKQSDPQITVAVGDVHGRLDLLKDLLPQCQAGAAQRGCEAPLYVFLGDYLDRGPDSAGVIAFLRAFGETHHVVALRGNHDQMAIDAVLGGDDGMNWAFNGMASTARSYGHGALLDQVMPANEKLILLVDALRSDERVVEDTRWLSGLPLSYHDDLRYFVHAGVRPSVPLDQQVAADQLWIREAFLRHQGSFGRLVVHGHTPTSNGKPDQRSNRICLDTGACWTDILTAAVFDELHPEAIKLFQTE